jgi:hypothetical protein
MRYLKCPQNEQTSQEQNDSDGTSEETLREARLEKFEEGITY